MTPNENGVVLQWVNPTNLGENEAIYSFTVNWRAVAPLSRSRLERIIRDDSAENASDSLARAVAQNATVSSILDADGDGNILSYDERAGIFVGDNCRHVANADQSPDADGDGIGDACDDEASLLRFIPGEETIRISWTNPAAGPPPLGSGPKEFGPYPSETAAGESYAAGDLTFNYDADGNVTVSWTNPDDFDGAAVNITSFSVSLSVDGAEPEPPEVYSDIGAGENGTGDEVSRPVLSDLSVTPAADAAYAFTVTATNSFNGSVVSAVAIGSGCVIVASATTFARCGDARPELPRDDAEEIGIERLLLIVEDGNNGNSIDELIINASRFLAYGAAAHYIYNVSSSVSRNFRFSLHARYEDGRNVTALVDDASSFAYSGAVVSGPNGDEDHLADAMDPDRDDDGIVNEEDVFPDDSALMGGISVVYAGDEDALADFESGANVNYTLDWLESGSYYTFSVEVGVRSYDSYYVSTRGYPVGYVDFVASLTGSSAHSEYFDADGVLKPLDTPTEQAALKVAETKEAVLVGTNNDGDDLADALDPDDDDDDLVDVIEVTFVHPDGVDCSLRADCDNDGLSDFDEVRGSALDETIGRAAEFRYFDEAANATVTRLCVVLFDCDRDGTHDGRDAFQTDETENADTDGDLQGDNRDNCVTVANADQRNSDGDGRGDACEGGDFRGDPTAADLLVRVGARNKDALGDPEFTNMTISWANHFYGDEEKLVELNAELAENMSLGVSDLRITEITLVVEQLNAANFSEVTDSYERGIYPNLASDSRIIEGEVMAEITGERTTYQFLVENEGYHNFTLTVTYGAQVSATFFNASITTGSLVADLVYVGRNTDGDDYADADELETDDDNDGVLDEADACPTGNTGWTATAETDNDNDGCEDGTDEDEDRDNDGVADGADAFPEDGTRDSDFDGDGLADNEDGCPLLESALAPDADADGFQDDLCDPTPAADALSFTPFVGRADGLWFSWRNVPAENPTNESLPFNPDDFRLTDITDVRIHFIRIDENGTALGNRQDVGGDLALGKFLIGDFSHIRLVGPGSGESYNFSVTLLYENMNNGSITATTSLEGLAPVLIGSNKDGDHLADAVDADADNDGVLNANERNFTNADGELVRCALLVDCDGDDVPDGEDAAPTDPEVQQDADGDGVDDGVDRAPKDPLLAYDYDLDGVDDERFDNCVLNFAVGHLGLRAYEGAPRAGFDSVSATRNPAQANADGDIFGDRCDEEPRQGDTVAAAPAGAPLTISYYAGPENALRNITRANVTFAWDTPVAIYLPQAQDSPARHLDVIAGSIAVECGSQREDAQPCMAAGVNITGYDAMAGAPNVFHATDLSNGTSYTFTITGDYEYAPIGGGRNATAEVILAELEIETFSAPLTPVMALEVVSSYEDMLVSWTIPDGDLTLVDALNISLVEVEVDQDGVRTDEERLIYSKVLRNLNPKANKAALTEENDLYDANGFISNYTIAFGEGSTAGSAARGKLYDVVVTVQSLLPPLKASKEDAGGFYPDVVNEDNYTADTVLVEHSDADFTLSWKAPPGLAALDQDEPRFREVTGFNLTGYKIGAARRSGGGDFSRRVDSEVFSFVFEEGGGLIVDNRLYDVGVVAVYVPPRTSDDERESQTVVSNQPGLIRPDPAEVASATVTSGETIEVSWSEPPTITQGRANNGAEIADYYSVTNYEVLLCNDTVNQCGNGILLTSDTFSATIETHMLDGLGLPAEDDFANPAVYNVAVRTNYGGVDRNGGFMQLDSSFGVVATVTGGYPKVIFYPSDSDLLAFLSELEPVSAAVSTASPGEVGVTWTPLALAANYVNNGFSVAGYRVEACPFSGGRDACVASGVLSQDTDSYRFEGDTVLLQGVEYVFTIIPILSDGRMQGIHVTTETTAQSELAIAEIQSGFDAVSFQWENSTVAIGGYRVELVDSSNTNVYTKTLRAEDLTAAIVTAGNVVHRINYDAPDADAATALERGELYTIRIFTIPAIGEAGADPTGESHSAVAFYPDVAVEEGYRVANVTVEHGADAFIVAWAAPTAPLANAENFRRITGFRVAGYLISVCRRTNSECVSASVVGSDRPTDSVSFPHSKVVTGELYDVSVIVRYRDDFGVDRDAPSTAGNIPGLIYPAPAVATEILAASGPEITVTWLAPEISEDIKEFYGVDFYNVFLCPVGDANPANCRMQTSHFTGDRFRFSSSSLLPNDIEYELYVSVAYAATRSLGADKQPIAGHVSAREAAAVQDESAYGVTDVDGDSQVNLIFYPHPRPEPTITAVTPVAGIPGSTSSTMTVEWEPPFFEAAHAANDYGVSHYIVRACIAGTDDCVSSGPLAATERSWTFTAAAGDGAIKEGLSYVVNITTGYAHGDNPDGSSRTTFNEGAPVAVPFTPIDPTAVVTRSGYDQVRFRWPVSDFPIAGYIVRLFDNAGLFYTSTILNDEGAAGGGDLGGDGIINHTVTFLDLIRQPARGELHDIRIYAIPLDFNLANEQILSYIAQTDAVYEGTNSYGFYPDVENDSAYVPQNVTIDNGTDDILVMWDELELEPTEFGGEIALTGYRVRVCNESGSCGDIFPSQSDAFASSTLLQPNRNIQARVGGHDFRLDRGELYSISVIAVYSGDAFDSAERFSMPTERQQGFIYPGAELVDPDTIRVISGKQITVIWAPVPDYPGIQDFYSTDHYDVTLCPNTGECASSSLVMRDVSPGVSTVSFARPSGDNLTEPTEYIAQVEVTYDDRGESISSAASESATPAIFYPTQADLSPSNPFPIDFGDFPLLYSGATFILDAEHPPLSETYTQNGFDVSAYTVSICEGTDLTCSSPLLTSEEVASLDDFEAAVGTGEGQLSPGVSYIIQVSTTYSRTGFQSVTAASYSEPYTVPQVAIAAVTNIRADFATTEADGVLMPDSLTLTWDLPASEDKEDISSYSVRLYGANSSGSYLYFVRTTESNETNSVTLLNTDGDEGRLLPFPPSAEDNPVYSVEMLSNPDIVGIPPSSTGKIVIGGFRPFALRSSLSPRRTTSVPSSNQYTYNISWEAPSWEDANLAQFISAAPNYNFAGYRLDINGKEERFVSKDTLMVSLTFPEHLTFGNNFIVVAARYAYEMEDAIIVNATDPKGNFKFNLPRPSLPEIASVTAIPNFAAKSVTVNWVLDAPLSYPIDVANDVPAPDVRSFIKDVEENERSRRFGLAQDQISGTAEFLDVSPGTAYFAEVNIGSRFRGAVLEQTKLVSPTFFGFDPDSHQPVQSVVAAPSATNLELEITWAKPDVTSLQAFIDRTSYGLTGYDVYACAALSLADCVGPQAVAGADTLTTTITPSPEGIQYDTDYYVAVVANYNSTDPFSSQDLSSAAVFHSQLPVSLLLPDLDGDLIRDSADIDDDGDGLIEIWNADMLHNVRYVLNGTGYRAKRYGAD